MPAPVLPRATIASASPRANRVGSAGDSGKNVPDAMVPGAMVVVSACPTDVVVPFGPKLIANTMMPPTNTTKASNLRMAVATKRPGGCQAGSTSRP